MQEACGEQLGYEEGQAARGVEVVHVREAVWIDLGHERDGGRDVGEVLQVEDHAGGAGHCGQVDDEVGRAARGHEPDEAVDEGAFVQHLGRGAVVGAECGDGKGAFGRGGGKGIAQGCAGIDEACTGQVQAHELHQHLVGIGRAVEGAGAGSVVACHLGGHERFAVDLSGGEFLANLAFLVVRKARGHRARRDEDCGQMSEGRGADDEAGDDLVADAEIEGGIEGIVGKGNRGGQRDDVAREEREFHPGLALGDAVAHGRHAACDLGRAAGGAGGGADEVGVAPEGLVGREHVVVGGHDAEVRRAGGGEGVLVGAGRRIGMGLVPAGEMRARRSL